MKVSVFMITYNHAAYIAQAIEGIVSQKTNFAFELVIGEDCSTDNTLAICRQYAEQYPGIIKLLPSDKNYGPMGNTIRTLEACTGTYIALCEGDDYWTDEYKLQKQIDFLDANPDFSLCFSAVAIKDEMGVSQNYEYFFPERSKEVFAIEDFILSEMNIIPTPTLVFRNVLPKPLPKFFTEALAGDMGLQLFATDKGKAKYFREKMAVYRNHAGGITKSKESQELGNDRLMKLYEGFNEFSGYKYDALFKKRFLHNAKVNLVYGSRGKKGLKKLKHYFDTLPAYLKYSDPVNIRELLYYHVVLFAPWLLKNKKQENE